jgi:molybdopterin converting factor small subunit
MKSDDVRHLAQIYEEVTDKTLSPDEATLLSKVVEKFLSEIGLALQSDMDKTIAQNISLKEEIESLNKQLSNQTEMFFNDIHKLEKENEKITKMYNKLYKKDYYRRNHG